MNDISVKIVETPKNLADDVLVVPVVEKAHDDEDPLAIKDPESATEQVESVCKPEAAVCDDKPAPVLEKNVECCDENAKEKIEGTGVETVEVIAEQLDRIQDEKVIKDNVSPESTVVNKPHPSEIKITTVEPVNITETEPENKTTESKPENKTKESKPENKTTETKPENVIDPPAKISEEQEVIEESSKVSRESEVPDVPDVSAENLNKLNEIVKNCDEEIKINKDNITEPQPKTEVKSTENKVQQVIKDASPVKEIVAVKEPEKAQPTEATADTSERKFENAELDLEIIKSKIKIAQAKLENAEKQIIAEINTEIPPQDIKKEALVPQESVEDKVPIISSEEVKILDVEMSEAPRRNEKKCEQKNEIAKSDVQVNGDVIKEEPTNKRRACEEAETDSPLKKLCKEVERTFPQHDLMINEFIQNTTKNNIDDIQKHTEQLLSEIQSLRELAQKKEHEWNEILHLKKVKEEILLRLMRRKQLINHEKSEHNGANGIEPYDYLKSSRNLAIDKSDEISGVALKPPAPVVSQPIPQPIQLPQPQPPPMQPQVMPVTSHYNPMAGLPPPYDKAAHLGMPKVYPQQLMMPGPTMPFPRDMNGQLSNYGLPMGRQGPTKDVKSIIADYRQRNPDITPRRGRRMKSALNPNMMNQPRQIAPKIENLNNLGMIFNNLDMTQKAMLERLSQIQGASLPNGMSFKDVLVQFANLQQGVGGAGAGLGGMPCRPEVMPHQPRGDRERGDRGERGSRRPERAAPHEEVHVSVKNERVASSSPRLPPPPPYPEISLLPVNSSSQENQMSQQNSLLHGILTKNCGEITITPVQPTPQQDNTGEKASEVVQLDDEESPQSEGSTEEAEAPRLVIDEGGGGAGAGAGGAGADDAPLCQGCRRRDAQFVCAGCANQWYCSRDCQVAAWDEHSEMCSG